MTKVNLNPPTSTRTSPNLYHIDQKILSQKGIAPLKPIDIIVKIHCLFRLTSLHVSSDTLRYRLVSHKVSVLRYLTQ